MKAIRVGLLGLGASLLLAGSMFAQNNPPANGNTKSMANGGVPTKDHDFMMKAAQGGMAEVELGQLAQQNAQSPEVKAFGERMVRDHTKAGDELKQLASQEGVALPTTLDAKDQATKQRLSGLHGAAFDKAYMQDMVTDHRKDIAEFKHEASTGNDQNVRNWAGKTLPTLESHLREAEKVAPTVGAQSSAMNEHPNAMGTTAQGR
jgi:putative membrane protein